MKVCSKGEWLQCHCQKKHRMWVPLNCALCILKVPWVCPSYWMRERKCRRVTMQSTWLIIFIYKKVRFQLKWTRCQSYIELELREYFLCCSCHPPQLQCSHSPMMAYGFSDHHAPPLERPTLFFLGLVFNFCPLHVAPTPRKSMKVGETEASKWLPSLFSSDDDDSRAETRDKAEAVESEWWNAWLGCCIANINGGWW